MRFIIRKNTKFYCERESLDDAIWELEAISRSWRHNGGIVIEHNDRQLIVTEENGEHEIKYEINIIEI